MILSRSDRGLIVDECVLRRWGFGDDVKVIVNMVVAVVFIVRLVGYYCC